MIHDKCRLENIIKPVVAILVSDGDVIVVQIVVGQAGVRGILRSTGWSYIIRYNRCGSAAILRTAGCYAVVKRLRPFRYSCLCGCRKIPAFT